MNPKEQVNKLIRKYMLRKKKLYEQCAAQIKEIYNACNHEFYLGYSKDLSTDKRWEHGKCKICGYAYKREIHE